MNADVERELDAIRRRVDRAYAAVLLVLVTTPIPVAVGFFVAGPVGLLVGYVGAIVWMAGGSWAVTRWHRHPYR